MKLPEKFDEYDLRYIPTGLENALKINEIIDYLASLEEQNKPCEEDCLPSVLCHNCKKRPAILFTAPYKKWCAVCYEKQANL